MKILAIGDIVGEDTLEKVIQIIPKIKKENNIDFIIANGENIVKARGINKTCFEKLVQAGVNAVTMGNHTYSNKEIYKFNACMFEIDESTGKTIDIKRINIEIQD